jgi:hypothetical protein
LELQLTSKAWPARLGPLVNSHLLVVVAVLAMAQERLQRVVPLQELGLAAG